MSERKVGAVLRHGISKVPGVFVCDKAGHEYEGEYVAKCPECGGIANICQDYKRIGNEYMEQPWWVGDCVACHCNFVLAPRKIEESSETQI